MSDTSATDTAVLPAAIDENFQKNKVEVQLIEGRKGMTEPSHVVTFHNLSDDDQWDLRHFMEDNGYSKNFAAQGNTAMVVLT